MKNFFILQLLVLLTLNSNLIGMQHAAKSTAFTKFLYKNHQRACSMRLDIPNEDFARIRRNIQKNVNRNNQSYIVTITPIDPKEGGLIAYYKMRAVIKDPQTKIICFSKANKE